MRKTYNKTGEPLALLIFWKTSLIIQLAVVFETNKDYKTQHPENQKSLIPGLQEISIFTTNKFEWKDEGQDFGGYRSLGQMSMINIRGKEFFLIRTFEASYGFHLPLHTLLPPTRPVLTR